MQITENIHALKIPFPSTGGEGQTVERFVYVYFIYGKQICMIYGGVSSAYPEIVDYLNKTGRGFSNSFLSETIVGQKQDLKPSPQISFSLLIQCNHSLLSSFSYFGIFFLYL